MVGVELSGVGAALVGLRVYSQNEKWLLTDPGGT